MSWLEDCQLLERIGKGSFGKVYRADLPYALGTGSCAIKVCAADTEAERTAVTRECAFLRRAAAHSNIVRFLGVCSLPAARGKMAIVLELCLCSLADLVRQRGRPLPDVVVLAVAWSVASALHFLHTEMGALHRDVKCTNLLLSTTGVVKLTDFNVSACRPTCELAIGTPQFMAPEVILGEQYSSPADMWSLGVAVLELAEEGRVPNGGLDPIAAMFRVVRLPAPELAGSRGPELRCVVAGLLNKHPAARLSAAQLLAHSCLEPVAPSVARTYVLCQLAWEQQTRMLSSWEAPAHRAARAHAKRPALLMGPPADPVATVATGKRARGLGFFSGPPPPRETHPATK
mmetsp:Transcript_19119/g.48708  ORF Transcript_19119/g.48708 Transcript_19119/m.48708 type:complete len:345 (-) Transcript_19119:2243-3277(-)